MSGDTAGVVSAVDALLVINEINQRHYSDIETGVLPRQLAERVPGNLVDVRCDNSVTPIDVLLAVNHINHGGPNGTPGGVYLGLACSPQLLESTDFAVEISEVLRLPDDTSAGESALPGAEIRLCEQGDDSRCVRDRSHGLGWKPHCISAPA